MTNAITVKGVTAPAAADVRLSGRNRSLDMRLTSLAFFELKFSKSRQLSSSLKQHLAKELPCASCRGRGYICCKECDINSPRPTCVHCSGEGILVCRECQGECVVQGVSVPDHQMVWEKLHSNSSIKVKDDEVIENMSIPVVTAKKRRVYGPVSAATRNKIRNALKELERRTGSISSRMRRLNQDPELHAKRVSAIQRAKGTTEARKQTSAKLIAFFMHPENRLKRSLSMRGVKYFCGACGGEGHRKSFCPYNSGPKRRRAPCRCSYCGTVGHRANTCSQNGRSHLGRAPYKCTKCGSANHNARTCPEVAVESHRNKCSLCREQGHNKRTCPREVAN